MTQEEAVIHLSKHLSSLIEQVSDDPVSSEIKAKCFQIAIGIVANETRAIALSDQVEVDIFTVIDFFRHINVCCKSSVHFLDDQISYFQNL